MKWETVRPWLGTVIRLALAAIWIWAAVSKLGSPRHFVQTVRAYDATPEWLSQAIGYGLPVLELAVGIVLVFGVVVRLAAVVSGLLFVVFLIGLVQAAARGLQLECGCFGGGGETAGSTQYTLDILRDIGLLVLAVYLVVWSYTRLSVEEFLTRHDYVEPPSAKQLRSDRGARKYHAAVEAKQKAAVSRSRYLNASIAIVAVLIALIGIGVQSHRAKIDGSLKTANANASNGVVYGQKAAATVDVYEDFQCPNCLNFEKSAHATLDADVLANHIQLRYHAIAFLDSSANSNYSTRAANAALCASDISVDTFVKYHNLLYGTYKNKQVQPPESGPGRTDAELETYAQSLGITGAKLTTFDSCVATQKHKAIVEGLTENASKNGVTGTPTIKVNGKKLGSYDLATVKKAIAAADAKGPAPSASPVPTKKASSGAASASSSGSGSATAPIAPSSSVPASSSAVPSRTAAGPSSSSSSP